MLPPLQFEVLDAGDAAAFLADSGALVVDEPATCTPALADAAFAGSTPEGGAAGATLATVREYVILCTSEPSRPAT